MPGADTLWDFREAPIRAGALDDLSARLDQAITAAGHLPRGGQTVDATLVAAPRQRLAEEEKAEIKAGRSAAEVWPERPAKARQKGEPRAATGSRPMANDARWTLQRSRAKARAGGVEGPIALAVPLFGYKPHVAIGRMRGLIGRQVVTDAARHDGARLREGLVQRANTARDVWADSAHRSAENEAWLTEHGMTSRIHRPKPRGRPMPRPTRRANARRAAVRARIEHVFAHRKARTGMTIRTIGPTRARAAITLADVDCNMTRRRWLNSRAAPA